ANFRAPFECRVERVMVALGSRVKKGDPLLEVFSSELAEAKSNFQEAMSQWTRARALLDEIPPPRRRSELTLERSNAESSETHSRREMQAARDKLLAYGLTEREIAIVETDDASSKSVMVLRARDDGVVVNRNVVAGNLYDSKEVLLAIARDDPLE